MAAERVTVNVYGIPAATARIAAMNVFTMARAGFGMKRWMEGVIDEARNVWVPIDTAALHDSAKVHGPFYDRGEVVVIGSFGPSHSERLRRGGRDWGMGEYAISVHEDWMEHPHGTWKYLITPFMSREHAALDVLQAELGF